MGPRIGWLPALRFGSSAISAEGGSAERAQQRQVDTAIHLDNLGPALARVGEYLGVDPTTVLNQPSETSRPDPRHPRPTSVLTRWR
jgi:hypothetical protein